MEYLEAMNPKILMLTISILLMLLMIGGGLIYRLILHIWKERQQMETARNKQTMDLTHAIAELKNSNTEISGSIKNLNGWMRGHEKRFDKLEDKVFNP